MDFVKSGTGDRSIIFLHGFCESQSIWDSLISKLNSHYTCYALKLPGFKSEFLIDGKLSIKSLAFLLDEFLTTQAINNAVLVGHSLGGYIIGEFIDITNKNISSIILINSSFFPDDSDKIKERNKVIDYLKKHGVEKFLRPFVPNMFYHKRRKELQKEIDLIIENAINTPRDVVVDYTEAMRDRKDTINQVKNSGIPVGMIVSVNDRIISLEKATQQISLLNIEDKLILDETGHVAMVERAEESYRFIKSFINKY